MSCARCNYHHRKISHPGHADCQRYTDTRLERIFLHLWYSILNTIERITSTFDGICHQTFGAAKTSLDTTESDSDDEEEYAIQINKFGPPIYRLKPAQYLNSNDPMNRYQALQAVLNPFRKVYVWKQVVSFLGSLLVPLQHVDWKPDYTRCFNKKEDSDGHYKTYKTIGTHDDDTRSSRSKRSRQYETVEEVMLPCVHHPFLLWEGCNQAANSRYNTKLAQLLPRLIYSPCVVDWNVLNQMSYGEAINEMLMIKLFLASTNKEISTSEAWTNAFNIDEPIYSELCHEFYSTYEFDKVCAADELRTKKIIKFRLFGRAFTRHQNGYANVAWLIARWMKMKGAGSQKESMICCGQCITKISKRKNLLSKEGRLIPEALEPGVPRVAILRPREHQCRICIRGDNSGVFEHMAKVYSVPLPGSYNPPGYDQ
ncbi:hypothetical protein Tco_0945717 [Tanacetum coccineum]